MRSATEHGLEPPKVVTAEVVAAQHGLRSLAERVGERGISGEPGEHLLEI